MQQSVGEETAMLSGLLLNHLCCFAFEVKLRGLLKMA